MNSKAPTEILVQNILHLKLNINRKLKLFFTLTTLDTRASLLPLIQYQLENTIKYKLHLIGMKKEYSSKK